MNKDLKYFMRPIEPEVVTVPGPNTIKDEEGNVLPLEIRTLSQETINKINDSYKKKTMATDKKGNPLIANGEVVWKTEWDAPRASQHIIVEALQFPDLHDPDLMKYYNCVDITQMPLKVFSRSDEFQYVSRMVMKVLGLSSEIDDDEEEDLEAAKN